MGVVRIGCGNLYVANQQPRYAIDVALSHKVDSWGWSEMGTNINNARLVGRRHQMHTLTAFGFGDRRDANDCVMHVSKDRALRHFSMTQVCDDANPTKLAHDRTFSMVAYELAGMDNVLAHIAIHPNWVKGFNNPNAQIVKEYVESVMGLEAMLRFAKAMGWHRVVTGDFNLPKRADKPFRTTYDVFRQQQLNTKTVNIDGMAWDKTLGLNVWKVIDKQRTGSDHPWIVAEFSY